MKIVDILKPKSIVFDIKKETKKDILTALAGPIAKAYNLDLDEVVTILLNREKLGSTGIGEGVAIPHGKIRGLKSITASIGKSAEGLDFDALDGKPCHIFFLLMAPADFTSGHLKALARVSMMLKNSDFRNKLMKASSSKEIYSIIEEQDKSIPE
ncbi:MAG: PTS sugar transporter subunit IIA [Thermodesulfobacteriota bacterium]|nr:PTS sugar transporter subunit IIA [Thermodesulfobacteriota bacterium]